MATKNPRITKNVSCPCGSGESYHNCCGRLHGGGAAANAEQLMRSRYAAYVLADEAYLLKSWHHSTRPAELRLHEEQHPAQWLGLKVLQHKQQDDNHAEVEFVARYKINGKACRLHENSRFVREQGEWFYVDGDIRE